MTEHTHGDPTRRRSCCRDFTRSRMSRRSLLQGAAAVGGSMAVTQMFGDATDAGHASPARPVATRWS